MSHIETRRVEIANYNKDVAKQAVELMSKDHGFEIQKGVNTVKAMDGRTSSAEMVIKHPNDNYAIGLNFSKGSLEVVGELWSTNRKAYDKVTEMMKAYYTGIAYGESMKQSGEFQDFSYTWDKANQEVVLEGLCYN